MLYILSSATLQHNCLTKLIKISNQPIGLNFVIGGGGGWVGVGMMEVVDLSPVDRNLKPVNNASTSPQLVGMDGA